MRPQDAERKLVPHWIDPMETKAKLWGVTSDLLKWYMEDSNPGAKITRVTTTLDCDSPFQRLRVKRPDWAVTIHHVYDVTFHFWADFVSAEGGNLYNVGFVVRYIMSDMKGLFGNKPGCLLLQRVILTCGREGNSSTWYLTAFQLRDLMKGVELPFTTNGERMYGTVLLLKAGEPSSEATLYLQTVKRGDWSSIGKRSVVASQDFESFDGYILAVCNLELQRQVHAELLESQARERNNASGQDGKEYGIW